MKTLKQYIFVKEAGEEKKITVREWQANWRSGLYDKADVNTMCKAGWFDWFCSDSSLRGRLEKLAKIVNGITNARILDNYYVWFKNNYPSGGQPLYDDVRFEPMNENERDDKYFMVTCDDKRNPSKYCLWTMKDGNNPGAGYNTVKQVVDAINEYKFL